MAKDTPNPQSYQVHFPSFRQVEWNPDPQDIGATVQGEILQAIVRNSLFDRQNATWRFASSDVFGRMFTNPGPINQVQISQGSVNLTSVTQVVAPVRPTREFLYLHNQGGTVADIGFPADGVTAGSIQLPANYAMRIHGYYGVVNAFSPSNGGLLFFFEI